MPILADCQYCPSANFYVLFADFICRLCNKTQPLRTSSHEEIRYHEAGHGVMAWLLGKRVISIITGNTSGECAVDSADYTKLGLLTDQEAYEELYIVQAGSAAQALKLRVAPSWALDAQGDFARAEMVCRDRAINPHDFSATQSLLLPVWDKVELVVKSLCDEGLLSEETFLSVVGTTA